MRWIALLLFLPVQGALSQTLQGKVIGIDDGDTLTILDAGKVQHRIRLADIDAPERKQAYGTQSRRSLHELCFQKLAEVVTQGMGRPRRHIGRVTCAGIDAGAEQVRRGMAWVSAGEIGPGSPLYELEAYARLRQLGLWADPGPIAPWEWRNRRAAKR